MIRPKIDNDLNRNFKSRLQQLSARAARIKDTVFENRTKILTSFAKSRNFEVFHATWNGSWIRDDVNRVIKFYLLRFQCCKMRLLEPFSNTVAKDQTVILNASHFPGARSNSQRLRSDVDNLTSQCANDMWSSWNATNTALQQRVTESTEAHNKLQSHMSKTMQEIYDQVNEKNSFFWSKLQFT